MKTKNKGISHFMIAFGNFIIILFTSLFIVSIFTRHLYYGLHPLLWIALFIISIIICNINSKLECYYSIIAIMVLSSILLFTIDLSVMFIRSLIKFPLLGIGLFIGHLIAFFGKYLKDL